MREPLLLRVAERFFRSVPPKRTYIEEFCRALSAAHGVRIEAIRHDDGVSYVILLHTPGYPRRFVVTPPEDKSLGGAALDVVAEQIAELLHPKSGL